MILQIKNLTGGYTKNHDILQGINLDIAKGDAVGIIGLNGSGKSSLAKACMNILPYWRGEILLNGTDITKKSTQELSNMGIAMFMQGGKVFEELSVYENLMLVSQSEKSIVKLQDYFLFLRINIAQLKKMRADKLSGGERSQLALAMSVLKGPSLLILDEPSAGLSPLAIDEIYQSLNLLRKKSNLSIMLIEQNVSRCVELCRSVNMIRNGKIAYSSENKNIKEVEKIMFNN
jgi:ABC-type branched-subunit amino acid transport system ATPase component